MTKTEDDVLKAHIASQPKLIVAVDLDGTLAEYDAWQGFFHIGAPVERVVAWVREQYKAGAHVIIHTCRVTTADNKVYHESVAYVKAYLEHNNIPYHEIWMATGKPFANIYLDDRARNVDCPNCQVEMDAECKRRIS
jgi:hypothetical protein